MLHIKILPALKDNYIFVGIFDNRAFVVDPAVAGPVLDFVKSKGLDLECILITHHHLDHTGGIKGLKKIFKNAKVIAPELAVDKIAFYDQIAAKYFDVCGLKVKAMDLPGHTNGHIGFYFLNSKILFCGDVLFSAGCGRIFDGSALQMFDSLQKINNLPEETKIYCAHEYTLSNLKFALSIDAGNTDIKKEIVRVKPLLQDCTPTIPTTLKKERLINPFLRIERYKKKFPDFTEEEIFAHLRSLKDNFC